ncbi:MAG: amino acid-binding protein [Clostridiales bacterium 44_9]|nr:MAG: amino acid-binding protein [Clostridiales bacterium 44_9]
MKIEKISADLSVCKVENYSEVDLSQEYCFIGKTDEENSLVCLTENVPKNVAVRDDGWKAFRVQGTLDFSLIGILSRISAILADNKIGIFAISTYNTDYILVKAENYNNSLTVLAEAGFSIV